MVVIVSTIIAKQERKHVYVMFLLQLHHRNGGACRHVAEIYQGLGSGPHRMQHCGALRRLTSVSYLKNTHASTFRTLAHATRSSETTVDQINSRGTITDCARSPLPVGTSLPAAKVTRGGD